MEPYKLGEMERKFLDLIWGNAPIKSRELVQLCEKNFNWKRTTTYTMLKRLEDRNIVVNKKGTIQVLMSKEEFQAGQGEVFLNENFDGSLPRFLATFTRKNKLSSKEIEELKRLIENYEEAEHD